ncbi:hypothetical protein [Niveispirillum irakense]|uniref:hypothetical protein n=1 Tax=Niveispirillum irakense TaxID=34011 RepID=UPI000422873C|nr:hypothetical protein [Niveispirillum irakense]
MEMSAPFRRTRTAIAPDMPFVALTPSARLALWGLRYWATCARNGRCPALLMRDVYQSAGVVDAAASIDALMRIFLRASRRTPCFGCPACSTITDDEALLLQALCHLQQGDGFAAEPLLASWLSPMAAEIAAPAMEGLACLLSRAGYLLLSDHVPESRPARHLH